MIIPPPREARKRSKIPWSAFWGQQKHWVGTDEPEGGGSGRPGWFWLGVWVWERGGAFGGVRVWVEGVALNYEMREREAALASVVLVLAPSVQVETAPDFAFETLVNSQSRSECEV